MHTSIYLGMVFPKPGIPGFFIKKEYTSLGVPFPIQKYTVVVAY
jgi:hypothetical protein